MNDWHEAPIGDLCVGIFDGPHATPKKTMDGPVFLGISNLNNGRLDLSDIEHLSEEDFVTWTRRVTPQPDDVVFSYETRLGEAAIIPDGPRCCLGRRMALMRPDRHKVEPRFLLYAFLGPCFQEVIRSRTIHGSTVDRIPLIDFQRFPIRVPDLPSQRAIAHILGTLDDKIELNGRMNQTLEEIARALFRSWFVDFDPVHAKAAGRNPEGMDAETAALFPDVFVDSEFGEIPEGWEVCDVYTVADVVYGAPFKSVLFNEDGVGKPLIRIRDLATHDPGVFTTEEHPRGYVVQPGDLIVGMDGEFRAHLWRGSPGWLNQRLCCFKPKAEVPRAFVHYSIERLLDFYERAKTGTTVIHLGKSDIDTFRVLVPPEPILRSFGQVVEPMDARVVITAQESRTLAALRNTLLPKLLSGELRIPDVVTDGLARPGDETMEPALAGHIG